MYGKRESAADFYLALLQNGFLSVDSDGILQERSHFLIVHEGFEIVRVYVLASDLFRHHTGYLPARPFSIPLLFSGCSLLCRAFTSHNPSGALDRVTKSPAPFVPSWGYRNNSHIIWHLWSSIYSVHFYLWRWIRLLCYKGYTRYVNTCHPFCWHLVVYSSIGAPLSWNKPHKSSQFPSILEAIWLAIVATRAIVVRISIPGIAAVFLQAAWFLIQRSVFCISV